MPFAEPLDGDILRIWFSPRDARNRSHLAWLEIDINNPQHVRRLAELPALSPGTSGRFDHAGVAGSCLVQQDDERRLYYIGWSPEGPDPYHISIGLAVSRPNGTTFMRHGTAPVLDRNPSDPFMVSTPYVLEAEGLWHMWYLSVTDWPDRTQPPHYNLRRATSADGVDWQTTATPCIDVMQETEIAIARPSVIHDKEIWRMWFCHRGTKYPYRIGYADSRDGIHWIRRDSTVGITVSESGWDSEMIAYPFIFDHNGSRYMLYAGNGFSRDGMGLAILEQD